MPVAGPLAHSTRDLRLFLETVIKSKPWDFDYTALAMSWHPVEEKKTLTIGVLYECPSWPVQPTIMRTMKTATAKLKEAGHNIVMLEKFPSFKEATELSWKFFDIDNKCTGFKHIEDSGEPWVTSVKDMYTPPPEGRKERKLDDLLDMTEQQLKFRAEWLKIFIENKLDVLVAPGSHKTAVPHDTFKKPPYTVMWNLLAVSMQMMKSTFLWRPFLTASSSILHASCHISKLIRPSICLTRELQTVRMPS